MLTWIYSLYHDMKFQFFLSYNILVELKCSIQLGTCVPTHKHTLSNAERTVDVDLCTWFSYGYKRWNVLLMTKPIPCLVESTRSLFYCEGYVSMVVMITYCYFLHLCMMRCIVKKWAKYAQCIFQMISFHSITFLLRLYWITIVIILIYRI